MSSVKSGTQCVYTIVSQDVIDAALKNGGIGGFEEHSRWVSAAKHLATLGPAEPYPLLLANAANIIGVEWVAMIEDIEIVEGSTRVHFSSVFEVPNPIPLDSFMKASNGQPLSPAYIRPYVPCLVNGGLEEAVLAGLAADGDDSVGKGLAEIESKSTADFVSALNAIAAKMTEKQRAMLIGHAKAPTHVLSMRALADIAGYPSHEMANIQYGTLGRKFADFFQVSDLPNQTQALAWNDGEPDEFGHFAWTLRQPLVEALQVLGWIPKPSASDIALQVAAREVDDDPKCAGVPPTVRQALIEARVGQGAYRARLVELWGGKCALTGCDLKQVLIASHARPWADSNNKERLDEYNGLLLAAHVDKLFDCGLISFANDGSMLAKAEVTEQALATLGVKRNMRLSAIAAQHVPYLMAHRVLHGFRS